MKKRLRNMDWSTWVVLMAAVGWLVVLVSELKTGAAPSDRLAQFFFSITLLFIPCTVQQVLANHVLVRIENRRLGLALKIMLVILLGGLAPFIHFWIMGFVRLLIVGVSRPMQVQVLLVALALVALVSLICFYRSLGAGDLNRKKESD